MDKSIAMQIIKRLISCILVLVFLLFGSNIAWLLAWYQYDYQTVEIEQDTEAENSDNLAIIDKEDEKVYYNIANDEIKHAGYLVNIAKRKTEKLAEGPDRDENGHNGMSSLDIIKEMHAEYMHNLAKVKELMNLRQ